MKFDDQTEQRFDHAAVPFEPASSSTARWVAVVLAILAVLVTTALWLGDRALSSGQNGLRFLNGETQAAAVSDARSFKLLADQLAQMQSQNASLRREIDALTAAMKAVREDAQAAQKQVRRVRDQNREQIKQLAAADTAVREQLATKANADDLRTVRSDVTNVRDAIKNASDEFHMSRSEMGTFIARNHDDIEVLRQMGQRDYFEFTLKGKNASEKMGDITIALRGTNPRRNECSLQLSVDDRTTEKRNRAINEPIFFYRERERQPLEIVINEIAANEVIGYLSVPRNKQPLTAIAGAK